jgi:hypothetical protein
LLKFGGPIFLAANEINLNSSGSETMPENPPLRSIIDLGDEHSAAGDPANRFFVYVIHESKPCGYGSIPINTIFRGMNIPLPAILMFTRGTRF